MSPIALQSTLALLLLVAAPALAQDAALVMDPKTGYRIGNYDAPTPSSVDGANTVDTKTATKLIESGAVLLDVLGPRGDGYDLLDGTWPGLPTHANIKGSIWLPNVGTGTLNTDMKRYFKDNLERLAGAPPGRPVIFYCRANCWMSWNAARRAAAWGYDQVYWYSRGTDGWRDAAQPLVPSKTPPTVKVE